MKRHLVIAGALLLSLTLVGCGDGLTYLQRQAKQARECEEAGGHWIDRKLWTGGLEQRCSFDSQYTDHKEER